MLQRLSEQVRACHERAAEAKQKAEAATDLGLKSDFLDMEKRWLALARSYAFTETLGDFTAANSEWRRNFVEHARMSAKPDAMVQLQEISTLLIQEGNLDVLNNRILDAAMNLTCADMGSFQRFDPEHNELRLLACKGFHPQSIAFWQCVSLDSATTCGMALSTGHRVMVPDIECCNFMAGTADLEEYRRSGIRAVQSTPLVSRSGRLLGMLSTHWREPDELTEYALRSLDVLVRLSADLIERTQAETALRENEAQLLHYFSIVKYSEDAIITKNLDGIITSWNNGAERLYGFTVEEAVGSPITTLIPSNRHDQEPAILERVRHGEPIENYETVRQHKDGRLIDVSLTISPIKDTQGKVVGASTISRDITERKRNDLQITMLAREAEHRTKNILATVQATVQLSHSDTVGGLKDAIQGRIQALAKVHSLFAKSRWKGAELGTLVAQELSAYTREGQARLLFFGPSIVLEPSAAQTIAVVLHEMATNAVKYGALSAAEGQVQIEWSQASDGRLVLRWTEMGGPPVTSPTRQGFGTRVMEGMIRALKGEIRFDWRMEGVVCEITIESGGGGGRVNEGRFEFSRSHQYFSLKKSVHHVPIYVPIEKNVHSLSH